LSVKVFTEKAVDDGVSGAVAVSKQLKNGKDSPRDRATMSTTVPQQIDLHDTPHQCAIYARRYWNQKNLNNWN